MTTNLSAELKKYYQVEGNKYVFRDKRNQALSLNRLAAKMSEEGGIEISPSNLSRVISPNSTQLFDNWQLQLFCKVLGLPEEEHWNLAYALSKDLCSRQGVEIDFYIPPPTLNLVIDNLHRVGQAKRAGNLKFALDMLNDLYKWKDSISKHSSHLLPPLVKIFYRIELANEELLSEIANSQYPSESITLVKPKFEIYKDLATMSDTYLVDLIRAEDLISKNLAIQILIERYQSKLEYYLRQKLSSTQIEDLSQEIWEAFYYAVRTSKAAKTDVLNLLLIIAKNKRDNAISKLVEEERFIIDTDNVNFWNLEKPVDVILDENEEEEKEKKLQVIKMAPHILNKWHSELWRLRYEQNLSCSEISKLTNKNIAAIYVSSHKIRLELQNYYENYYK